MLDVDFDFSFIIWIVKFKCLFVIFIFFSTTVFMDFRFSLTDIFRFMVFFFLIRLCWRILCFYDILVVLLWLLFFFWIYYNRLNWDFFHIFVVLFMLEIAVLIVLLNSSQLHFFNLLLSLNCWRFWLCFAWFLFDLIWSLLFADLFGKSRLLLLVLLGLMLPIHIVWWSLICHHSVMHSLIVERLLVRGMNAPVAIYFVLKNWWVTFGKWLIKILWLLSKWLLLRFWCCFFY